MNFTNHIRWVVPLCHHDRCRSSGRRGASKEYSMYCHQAIENKLGTFILSKSQIANLAECFRKSMLNRLNGSESSLKMLPAFLDKPTGEERGRCIAVDFGGSKIRLLIVHLKGHREYEITKEHTFLLKDPHNRYNFTTASTTGSELFAFIVSQIADFIDDNSIYPLGHTFSFPTLQRSSNDRSPAKSR